MRKISFLVLTLALLLSACSSPMPAGPTPTPSLPANPVTPVEVMEVYNAAVTRFDTATMAKLTCAAEQDLVEPSIENIKTTGIQYKDMSQIEYEVTETTANRVVVHNYGPWTFTQRGIDKQGTLDEYTPLVKEEGVWKVCQYNGKNP